MTIAIETQGLTRTYRGVPALDHVSVQVRANTITGLLGRNGAGKTTLMSLITAQDRPTAGRVVVDGEEPFENANIIENMCFIRDNQRYPDDYQLIHALRAARIFYPNWSQELADELITLFRIPKKPVIKKFSRGQLSSLGIVLGLASRAPITFFDEPYLGLDATARHHFYDVLIRDYTAHPRTIVLSTHLINEMDRLLEDVIVLEQGSVIRHGTVDELLEGAYSIAGTTQAMNRFVEHRTVLSRRTIGGLSTAIIEGELSNGDRAAAKTEGLELTPVPLQDLVAAFGVAPTDSLGSGGLDTPPSEGSAS